MSDPARQEYGEQLRLRKAGFPSTLGSDASLDVAKPHYYTDARLLINGVRQVYASYRQPSSPYGLFDRNGDTFMGFETSNEWNNWLRLEQMLSATARRAYEAVTPPRTGCPYHEALHNLGSIPLKPIVTGTPDVERLREVAFPGAKFAPAFIVNILRRMPALAEANKATVSTEELAHNSAHTLLNDPLHHPQQHAKAFNFCLADGLKGTDFVLDRPSFMLPEIISRYTKLGTNLSGKEAIHWSMPTSDFTLRAAVSVANRLQGSELDVTGDHITVYPIGTRLGDIKIDEPTIGCPGSQMAYDMYDQAIEVIVGEGLWEYAA